MTGFWLAATAMVIVAVVLVVRPLIERRSIQGIHRDQFNLDIARERLQELESVLAKGEISEAEFDEFRAELEDTLLVELSPDNPSNKPTKASPYWPIGLAMLLPIAVIGLYLQLGTPTALFHPKTQNQPTAGNTSEGGSSLPSVEVMIEQVQARLEEHPNDERGWSLLANAMMKLGRYAEGVAAYEELFRLTGDEPEVLVRYADALAMTAGGNLSGKPTALLDRALEIDPLQPQGLWLAGIAAEERGDLAKAVRYWYRLEPLLTDEPDSREHIETMIERVRQQASAQNMPIPQRPGISSILSSNSATSGLSLRIWVEIDPTLANLVSNDDALFVFARAKNIIGPVAVIRRTAGQIPIEVVLDDSTTMMSDSQLSDFDRVEIGARVSRSGDAAPRSGDLASDPIMAQVQDRDLLRIMISRVIP